MHLIVPFLFPPDEFLQMLPGDLRLPALEIIASRGKLGEEMPASIEQAMCRICGIEVGSDCPWAPASLLADGGNPGQSYWLRADPVHLMTRSGRLIMAPEPDLNIEDTEAVQLTADLAAHFSGSFKPQAAAPERWYWRLDADPGIATIPLSRVRGRDIQPLLPRGAEELKWLALLNEIQMVLHNHPVNERREARGLPAINSVWLWGGGRSSRTANSPFHLYCEAGHLADTMRHFGIQAETLPADPKRIDAGGVVLLHDLHHAALLEGLPGWANAAIELDRKWLSPLARRRVNLMIKDPLSGKVLRQHSGDHWKFWRRPKPLFRQPPPLAWTQPQATGNVDEFGNPF